MFAEDDVFTFHTDPGHGWIEVPKETLAELGIEQKITPFSYQRQGVAFLEEDCDAGTFAKAWEERTGVKFTERNFSYRHENYTHPIRSYDNYTA